MFSLLCGITAHAGVSCGHGQIKVITVEECVFVTVACAVYGHVQARKQSRLRVGGREIVAYSMYMYDKCVYMYVPMYVREDQYLRT